jgi:alkylhydroperoxidase family enzyme
VARDAFGAFDRVALGHGDAAAARAALELTEQGTRIADKADAVTDEAWANAAKHYDEDQLAALVCAIAVINAFNTANALLKQPGGDYYPGQLG